MDIQLAETDAAIDACFPVMVQLRPKITRETFVARVRLQMTLGYLLAAVEVDGEIITVAGFRIGENLAWGKFLYVDDLISSDSKRSQGGGKALLDWLQNYAREQGCNELHLDSGVQRDRAHRFYFREKMHISSLHFGLSL